jgi:Protein of unknown function (DUF2752)
VSPVSSSPATPPPLPRHRSPRRAAAVVAAIGLSTFVVAAWLSPYEADGRPRVSGTHRQLGLPPCQFESLFHAPCPSCGMTTSLALLMDGDLAAAWRANWAGVVVAAMAAVAVAWLLTIALAGIDPGRWSVEWTVERLALGGAAVAAVRYVAVALGWLLSGS